MAEFFDGNTPTVAGWVIIFVAVVLLLAAATLVFCWYRGYIACCARGRLKVLPPRDRLSVQDDAGSCSGMSRAILTAQHGSTVFRPGTLLRTSGAAAARRSNAS